MFCSKCGAKISDDSAFCSKCGAKINNPVPAGTPSNLGTGSVNTSINSAPKKSKAKGCLTAAAIAFGVFVIFPAMIGYVADTGKTPDKTTAEKSTQTEITTETEKAKINTDNDRAVTFDFTETAAVDNTSGNDSERDPELCGRWRNYDGGKIELSSDGSADTTLNFGPFLYEERRNLKWSTENGKLLFTGDFVFKFTYVFYDFDDTFKMGEGIMHRTSDNAGNGLYGTWNSSTESLSNPKYYTFNADGTGFFENISKPEMNTPYTWYLEESKYTHATYLCIAQPDTYAFDYSVTGSILTVYFSDGSQIYERVGN